MAFLNAHLKTTLERPSRTLHLPKLSSHHNPVHNNRWYRDPVLWALIGAGAVFLCARLGQRLLWQDEAETAILARNILRFGYPRAFDGVNLVWLPGVHRSDFAWAYAPWAPFYLTAGVFALAGVSTLTARLPFALIGLACLPLAYAAAQRVSASRAVARWTAGAAPRSG